MTDAVLAIAILGFLYLTLFVATGFIFFGERAMTDEELTARLRENQRYEWQDPIWETRLAAADRIEAMTKERDEAWKRAAHAEKMWGEAEVKLAKAVEALRQIADPISLAQGNVNAEIARATLAEIKGDKL